MADRDDVVSLARHFLGSSNWQVFWADVCHPNPPKEWHHNWCGAFAMSVLKRAGILSADACWIAGRGFVYPYKLPQTQRPEPGDVAYADQPFQHHMLVSDYDPATDMVTTIGGNELNPAGGSTIVRERGPRSAKGLQFYSIAPFVRDSLIPLVAVGLLVGFTVWRITA